MVDVKQEVQKNHIINILHALKNIVDKADKNYKTMKKSQLRQLVREVINEYESSEIFPGIEVNDENQYDIEDSVGKSLYNKYLKNSTFQRSVKSAV